MSADRSLVINAINASIAQAKSETRRPSKTARVTPDIGVRVPRAGLVTIRVDEDEESLTYQETRRLIAALTKALPANERPSVDLLPHLREAFSYIASDMAGNRLSDFPLYRQLRDAVKRGERAAALDA